MVQVIFTETEQRDLLYVTKHYQVAMVSLAVFLSSLLFTKLNTWRESVAEKQVKLQERTHADLCVQWG
jgi:hypothetical protein